MEHLRLSLGNSLLKVEIGMESCKSGVDHCLSQGRSWVPSLTWETQAFVHSSPEAGVPHRVWAFVQLPFVLCSHRVRLNIGIKDGMVLFHQCLGWLCYEREDMVACMLLAVIPNSRSLLRAFPFFLCQWTEMPTVVCSQLWRSRWVSGDHVGALKMICYTSFWEFYSRNRVVLWNPHLNELHDLWKVWMLTPALQIDKLRAPNS